MNVSNFDLLQRTRRHFFAQCGIGLGTMALGSVFNQSQGGAIPESPANPLSPRPGHFPAKAKNVIFLFMAGGPSQFELLDFKPELQKRHNQPIPDSFIKGKRFAFMNTFAKETPKLLGTKRKFSQHGSNGAWISECLPHTSSIVDDLTIIHSMVTEPINHAPAKLYMNTGSTQFGRPSLGSWLTYGIGSESNELPGFVVLQSGPRGPRGGAVNWGSGFLPSVHQGVPFRSGAEPILNLSSPNGVDGRHQRQALDAIRDLNRDRLDVTGDPEIATRIASYEMAFRMQTSAPELIDLRSESRATLDLYGVEAGKPSFGANCLLARRLVERGVRFIQLYHTDWDHHGGPGQDLAGNLDNVCRDIDRPCMALIQDLKARGLLDETLVVWGGEFGRTPMGEVREYVGRNHHVDAFTMWMAGGGTKPGLIYGATDDFGFQPVEGRVNVHDLQATMLHLLGLDHKRLTYRSQGRDFRLTDVEGTVVADLLA